MKRPFTVNDVALRLLGNHRAADNPRASRRDWRRVPSRALAPACFLAALSFAFVVAAPLRAAEQPRPQTGADHRPDRLITYKTVGDTQLKLHVFLPKEHAQADRRSAVVFFFGGGWTSGTPAQFYPQCRELAARGMVAMSAEYRVKSRNGTTPFECVKDGKSAIRYVRSHADALGVDPAKIVAGGGSAGGHVAACTGLIDDVNGSGEDTSVSAKPVAMALFNPAVDLGYSKYIERRVGENWKAISPVHRVDRQAPPTIIFNGSADTTTPIERAEKFQEAMQAAGAECKIVSFDGAGHGFFNYGRGGNVAYEKSMKELVAWLKEQKLL